MPRSAKSVRRPSTPAQVLYLYAISEMPKGSSPAIVAEGIDGSAGVEAVRCGDYLCWISRVSSDEFGDRLNERMQDLEWLATTGVRHQRVVAEISSNISALPARFATVFRGDASLANHVKQRTRALREALQRVAGTDEWGVKVFELAAAARSVAITKSASGSDYLKRKAQLLQPRTPGKVAEVQQFVSALTKLAVASSPGGKASAGQPGLVWHGSFLIRRKDRKKLEAALRKYAAKWRNAWRVDCSGPWPPYSFVGEHVQ